LKRDRKNSFFDLFRKKISSKTKQSLIGYPPKGRNF